MFLFRGELLLRSTKSSTHMIKVKTPTLQMSAGGPTTSPFNISGAASGREERIVNVVFHRGLVSPENDPVTAQII